MKARGSSFPSWHISLELTAENRIVDPVFAGDLRGPSKVLPSTLAKERQS